MPESTDRNGAWANAGKIEGAANGGETKVGDLKGASKQMYESMSEDQLEEFAATKRKGKPAHVK